MKMAEAEEILRGMMEKPALLAHVRSVSLVMGALAEKMGEDRERWEATGLLHDADYDRWPEEHPRRIVALLRERGEEEMAHAISAHSTHWGVPLVTRLDKALLACDELTGFIIAVARVRPNRLQDLTAKSVLGKLKDKSFAVGCDRNEIRTGVDALGADMKEHIEFIISVLRPREAELII